jgi:hypothetical protein
MGMGYDEIPVGEEKGKPFGDLLAEHIRNGGRKGREFIQSEGENHPADQF